MKKLWVGLMIIGMTVMITACNDVDTVGATVNVISEHDSIKKAKLLEQVVLAKDEQDIINDSLLTFESSRIIFKSLPIDNLQYEIDVVRKAYNNMRIVIILNFDKYPEPTQQRFRNFDRSMGILDEKFKKDESIKTALTIIDTAFKLASLYIR